MTDGRGWQDCLSILARIATQIDIIFVAAGKKEKRAEVLMLLSQLQWPSLMLSIGAWRM